MSLSAVERTPVEVWRLILGCAVATPLRPFTDKGVLSTHLLDNLYIFSPICSIRLMYRKTQATIERLRLVCQAWANLLQDYASDFGITDLGSRHYTSERTNKRARRINLYRGELCTIHSPRPRWNSCPGYCGILPLPWKEAMEDENFLLSRIPNAFILILDPLLGLSLNFLTPLSNLVALSLRCWTSIELSWSIEELPTCAPRLSHLSLRFLQENSIFLSKKLFHPHLRYLSLEITIYSVNPISHFEAINWTFPSLQTLIIYGLTHP
ncbi:hypothetical protein CPB86DRAFT_553557 [Serendipita vermifera]|nr:hypothetical protein CPB86DRAFT_553557 [Serendipita vermifera]